MNELLFILSLAGASFTSVLALCKGGKDALTGLICIQVVLVNFFVTKQIAFLGLTATASDGIAVGITLALNLLQEYYTEEASQRALAISFLGAVYSLCITYLALAYVPAATDTASFYFEAVFTPLPRIVLASLTSYAIVYYLNIKMYEQLRQYFKNRFFVLRNYGTLIITQALDTFLFSILGLYGLNESFSSVNTLVSIGLTSYSIKMFAIAFSVPFIKITRTFICSRTYDSGL